LNDKEKPKWDDEEESERFRKAGQKIETDDPEAAFDFALKKILPERRETTGKEDDGY
jgi:hypothetical protein